MIRDEYSIEPKAEEYLHNQLYIVVFNYLSCADGYQRYFDSFRGSLGVYYHLNQVGVKSFVFLVNFLCWLENKEGFSEADDDMYDYFYDGFIKDLYSNFDF